MSFDSCPECGETNYKEEWTFWKQLGRNIWLRTFDCGFQGAGWNDNGNWESARKTECGEAKERRKAQKKSNGYRLALYDAASLMESLAKAMREGQKNEEQITERHVFLAETICTEMRRFAGGGSALIDEKSAPSGAPSAPGIPLLKQVMNKLKT